MGKLIATTQATVDGVIDPVGSGCSRTEITATTRSSVGRDPAGSCLAPHVLGGRGPVRLQLEDVKRFESGVVLLTYLPGVLIAAVPGSSSISAGSDARPRSGLSSIRVRASKYTYDVTRATKGIASA
jgi:hypothetical protein